MAMARAVVRILMGVAWLFFGLNGFLHFFSPPPPTGAALTYFTGLMASGYVFPLLAAIELAAGLMLLTGRFVPLALMLLAPILVNIVAFHLVLDLKGLGTGALFTVLELFLLWSYRAAFKGVLAAKHSFDAEGAGPAAAVSNAQPA